MAEIDDALSVVAAHLASLSRAALKAGDGLRRRCGLGREMAELHLEAELGVSCLEDNLVRSSRDLAFDQVAADDHAADIGRSCRAPRHALGRAYALRVFPRRVRQELVVENLLPLVLVVTSARGVQRVVLVGRHAVHHHSAANLHHRSAPASDKSASETPREGSLFGLDRHSKFTMDGKPSLSGIRK